MAWGIGLFRLVRVLIRFFGIVIAGIFVTGRLAFFASLFLNLYVLILLTLRS